MIRACIAAGACAGAVALSAVLLGGWFLLSAGASADQTGCTPTGSLKAGAVPSQLVPIFNAAAARYQLGGQGPAILAGLTEVESRFGRDMGPSSAGAVGWTQFLPSTWATFGTDANGDGKADPANAADAIFSTARYLRHLGAPGDWHAAIYGYNHAEWYVRKVLAAARRLASSVDSPTAAADCEPSAVVAIGSVYRDGAQGAIVPIPGSPGMSIDRRILPDLLALQARFHFAITAGFAPTGHAPNGEHPLALAVDLIPGPGGTWDDIDALAHYAEPTQNHPRAPWRWVGYDGDSGHGRGNHLHLSWNHAPAPSRRPPARWVDVFATGAAG